MDSICQIHENRNEEMEGIAGEQMRDAEEVNAGPIMQPEMFLAEQQNRDVAFRDEMQELRDRITAVLDKIKKEKKENAKSTEELISDFLDLKFSTRELKADYVIQHLDSCLQNIELIRCVKELEHQMDRKAYAPVKRKLEAVKEYPDVVESALWEYGLRINFNTFEVMKINENDENFGKRRRAYLAGGSWRYSFGVKRCSWMKKYPEFFPDNARLTRVEEMLSAFEAELDISIFREGDMRIVRSFSRSVGKLSLSEPEDVIRADGEDAQGKMEDRQVKMRFLMIYHSLKKRLEANFAGWAEDFQLLERFVEDYVCSNREIYEDRRAAEESEAQVFGELKDALVRASNSTNYQCSKYAAVLLGLLTQVSNGYLEVPADGIHIYRKEKDITLGKGQCEYRDCTDMPLFAHRPNIKDIEQGGLGDCYLLAGLISVVSQNPEEIMNIMRDNGDGTVTVCFKLKESGKNGGMVFTPYYVTVRKTIPVLSQGKSDVFSRGALWVKMMEKAYVASGIHLLREENPEQIRNSYRNLREFQKSVDYCDIEGGLPGKFISLLLGKKNEFHFLNTEIDTRQEGEHGAGNENGRQISDRLYTDRERRLYERIEQSLRSGAYVSFVTRELSDNKDGKNGESVYGGLVGTHAYSLINTRRIMVNNEERLCFVVMNPWAHMGVVYQFKGYGYYEKAVDCEKEEGVFLLDLKTFAEVVIGWEEVPAETE